MQDLSREFTSWQPLFSGATALMILAARNAWSLLIDELS